jgi:hypothetical protein
MTYRERWTDDELDAIWAKGRAVSGYDPLKWRKDVCGAWMSGSKYGDRESRYGWEVDHIDGNPENNAFRNLRPLHWKNNAAETCAVTSDGNRNALTD